MIAPGKYRARGVQGSQQLTISSTGNEQVILDLDVQVGGRVERVKTYLAFAGKAMTFSLRRLRALGWTGTDITRLTNLDANDVDVEVKEDTYEGKTRTVVEIVAPRETKPLEGRALREFALRVAVAAAESAAAPDPAVADVATDDNGDEIPF